MPSHIKKILLTELAFLISAPTLVMLGIVIYGVLTDYWYKDPMKVLLTSILIYLIFLMIRFFVWLSGKTRSK